MSLLPLLFSEWWEALDRPHRLLDQNFGLGLSPEQLLSPSRMEVFVQPRRNIYANRPWSELRNTERGTSTVQADKDKFQVVLDVQQFKPNEIDVRVVDKFVVVTAKHEEKRDEHGWISRQFSRRYLIPEQCDIDQAASKLSSDGVLTITVPRKHEPNIENERVIKIEHTGKPALQMRVSKQQQQQQQQQQQSVKQGEENEEKQ
ncbi:Protein lethal(2)essential for life [Eufriesea mexicana]|uniref:Protein lethal(2)essential for life n=1 Tax=Eufriesea mexicana TaxID=516756 RepID=A0A310SA51_9HYME|nr:PREDICTED: protein lethal(2)essential for life-like [Eufriesea mexicana]OAD53798.1 Protein lethal(2)essential for life [Eufriesea mexicana]